MARYCKFGNIRENFISLCMIIYIVHDSDFVFSRGGLFSRNIAKINPRENSRIYRLAQTSLRKLSRISKF